MKWFLGHCEGGGWLGCICSIACIVLRNDSNVREGVFYGSIPAFRDWKSRPETPNE